MALSDAQFDAWRRRRTARLTGVPWLRSKPTRNGTGAVFYVALVAFGAAGGPQLALLAWLSGAAHVLLFQSPPF